MSSRAHLSYSLGAMLLAALLVIAARTSADNLHTSVFLSICGDGIVQPEAEVCDDGAAFNVGGYGSTTVERKCNAGCQSFGPYCGDGILQVRYEEECDDLNSVSGDLCSARCEAETPSPPGGGCPPMGYIPPVAGSVQSPASASAPTQVILRGKAFPNSVVSILLDGKTIGTVRVDANADFFFTSTEITPGTASFGFVATDPKGVTSIAFTAVFEVIQSAITTVANIFLPPTLSLESAEIEPGGFLNVSGYTVPNATVITQVNRERPGPLSAEAERNGSWALQLDTRSLSRGEHSIKASFTLSTTTKSGWGKSIAFRIGAAVPDRKYGPDINLDGKVNLIDFSIFLTLWNSDDPRGDFNGDGTANLADFSIMLFEWTG